MGIIRSLLKAVYGYFCAASTAASVRADAGLKGSVLFLQVGDVGQQFVFTGHAGKKENLRGQT